MRPVRNPLVSCAIVCLLALAAGCAAPRRATIGVPPPPPERTFVVARDPGVARRVTAPSAPALVTRAADGAGPRLARTRLAITAVGPVASVDRTKSYVVPDGVHELLVAFTPPAAPARQDYAMQSGGRSFAVWVRDPAEARELAKATPHATLVRTDAAGLVTIPLDGRPSRDAELRVQTIGVVPWNDGAYELAVPRAPEGDVALTADVHGPGPLVVMSSPSHAIDVQPLSLEHLRVALRDPGTLRDGDFLLRYRVDPADRPGAFVVEGDGTDRLVGLLVHPFESAHEPVTAADVAIDWNGTPVTEVRPAHVGTVGAGTPLVIVARTTGDVHTPIWVRARIGRETRTLTLTRCDAVRSAGLASLWARAVRATVTAKR